MEIPWERLMKENPAMVKQAIDIFLAFLSRQEKDRLLVDLVSAKGLENVSDEAFKQYQAARKRLQVYRGANLN